MARSILHGAGVLRILLGTGLLLAALTGCQSLSSDGTVAHVRVVDLSANTPAVDIYHGENAIAYNLSFGSVTSYISLPPGNSSLSANQAGSSHTLVSGKGALLGGARYTVLLRNTSGTLQQSFISDQTPPSIAGQASLRLLDEAKSLEPVDVYLVPSGKDLSSVNPLVRGLTFGANTGYLHIAPGAYTTVVLPAGAIPNDESANLTENQVDYEDGSARTMILADPQRLHHDLHVITLLDAEPGQ